MIKDLRWILPFDEEVQVNRHGPRAYVVDHFFGDGGTQSDPYPTRKEAREAAIKLIHQRNIDLYGRPH